MIVPLTGLLSSRVPPHLLRRSALMFQSDASKLRIVPFTNQFDFPEQCYKISPVVRAVSRNRAAREYSLYGGAYALQFEREGLVRLRKPAIAVAASVRPS